MLDLAFLPIFFLSLVYLFRIWNHWLARWVRSESSINVCWGGCQSPNLTKCPRMLISKGRGSKGACLLS